MTKPNTTIDLTPTFAEATAMCLAILDASYDTEARRIAKEELMRYAKELDRLVAAKRLDISR